MNPNTRSSAEDHPGVDPLAFEGPRFARRADDPTVPPRELRMATAASALGNATEWFDYGAYAVATAYIASHFFEPFENARLLTLATFAISFLVRPLGGFIWGPLGDRIGRRAILALTILLMSGATFLIGVLPGYGTIGAWAPILLIVLRMVQGFSTGGEYGGAATFMAEYAPDRRRGFFGSFLEFGTLGGFALGTAIMLLLEATLPAAAMESWGWRLPFLLALPLGGIGLFLRMKLEESPVYSELNDEEDSAGGVAAQDGKHDEDPEERPGLIPLISEHWKPMLVLSGLVFPLNIVNYTLLAYMPTYLEQQIGLPSALGLSVILIGELLMMLGMPFAGAFSDRHGRRNSWKFSMILLAILAVPMFWLMGMSFPLAIVGFTVLGLLYIPQLATITATFPAMFPTQVRFAGFAVTYNLITSIFGGTAASINDWAIGATGSMLFPAFYMTASCLIGLLAVHFMPETAGASLHGTQVPGTLGSAVALESPAAEALAEGRQPEQRGMDEREMHETAVAAAREHGDYDDWTPPQGTRSTPPPDPRMN